MFKCLLLVFVFPISFLEGGNLNRIKKFIDKLEYEKAKALIDRSIIKEPNHPGLNYFSAVLYASKDYGNYNLDTARIFVNRALENVRNADLEMIEDLADGEVTLDKISSLSVQIREEQFQVVLQNLSVERAIRFLIHYPESPYDDLLTFKRDSILYDQVVEADSKEAYKAFLEQYVGSSFTHKAAARLDELRYETLRLSTAIEDYYAFLEDYPKTKFRLEVERYIFQRSTVGHQIEDYLDFIEFAKTDLLRKRAGDVLFYIHGAQSYYDRHPFYDSLIEMNALRDVELLPVLAFGKFGFYTNKGTRIIDHFFQDIHDWHKCELVKNEWLLVKDSSYQIIDRKGNVLIKDAWEYDDLGSGTVKVKIHENWFLYHKSGFRILPDPVEDAQVAGQWIKVRQNGKWGLFSVSGYPILECAYESIDLWEPFWLFEKNGLLAVCTTSLILEDLKQKRLELEFKFDDLELVPGNKIIGFWEDKECLMDEQLHVLVPWGSYEIFPKESGGYLKTAQGYRFYDSSEEHVKNHIYPYIESNEGWTILKTPVDWMLLPKKGIIPFNRGYDSLKLINEHCVYTAKSGGAQLLFTNGNSLPFGARESVRRLANHPNYLLHFKRAFASLVNGQGEEVIKGRFSDMEFLNDTVVKVEIDGKQGLLDIEGHYLLDAEYETLDEADGLVSCLKRGKIGCYDLTKGIQIAPMFESRIERLGENYLVMQKGKYGLLNGKGKMIISCHYDKIFYWNDISVLVRVGNEWSVLSYKEKIIGEKRKFLTKLAEDSTQSYWRYMKNGQYGLLASRGGLLLDPEFTNIYPIDSSRDPLFFAYQKLGKAGFHVVSYIDKEGKRILSKAYIEEEFGKVSCKD